MNVQHPAAVLREQGLGEEEHEARQNDAIRLPVLDHAKDSMIIALSVRQIQVAEAVDFTPGLVVEHTRRDCKVFRIFQTRCVRPVGKDADDLVGLTKGRILPMQETQGASAPRTKHDYSNRWVYHGDPLLFVTLSAA